MARTRWTVVGAAIIAFSGASLAAQAPPRIRTTDPGIDRAIAEAAQFSGTFRRLVGAIEKTDGLVWVSRGRCRGAAACLLLDVVVSGPYRLLRIQVTPGRSGDELMESLGHELQHAVEVLGTPAKSGAAMYQFFDRQPGVYRLGGKFETNAAVLAGVAVGTEVARARRVHDVR